MPSSIADNMPPIFDMSKTSLGALVGQSGRIYSIEQVLQDKGPPLGRVCVATSGQQKFVLKDIPRDRFKYYEDMYRDLPRSPNLRLLDDTIPERSIFVFKYLFCPLLHLVAEGLPLALSKRILKDTLRGLAALHDQHFVHTDIKADNIMVEAERDWRGICVKQVQLTDLESGDFVPPGHDIVGSQVGNHIWRSPEAHLKGRVNKPSDMFSFGIVCIFAINKRHVLLPEGGKLEEGVDPSINALFRQLSFFADNDGFDGLMKYLGNNPLAGILPTLLDGFDEEEPRKPLHLWQWENVDEDFVDLVGRLTNLDPARRLTAHEALAHSWFRDV